MAPYQAELDFALRAARLAGEITLKHFQTNLEIETKSDGSPVTVADKECEKFLRGLVVEEGFNRHGLDRTPFTIGATSSLDFHSLIHFPIGLLLTFNHNSFAEGGDDNIGGVQSFGTAIAYTGRKEFSVSLESTSANLKIKGADDASLATQMLLNIQYYF